MLAGLLEKLKIALSDGSCALCGASDDSASWQDARFCKFCQGELGFRPAEPLRELASFHLYAATQFNPRIKKLIYGHKFYNQANGHLMADILASYWESLPHTIRKPERVMVVPVPAHAGSRHHLDSPSRRFARHLGYDYRDTVLRWAREVEPQHRLYGEGVGKRLRFQNVAQAMQVRKPEGEAPECIIVVDDLTTTGATLQEAARAFRAAYGAPSLPVYGLAVCAVPFAVQKIQRL